MPLVFLLLGAGGLYWWWKNHQSTAPALPAATGAIAGTQMDITGSWGMGGGSVPMQILPTYGVAYARFGQQRTDTYGPWGPLTHTGSAGGMYDIVGAGSAPAVAMPLPNGASDGGLAHSAVTTALQSPTQAWSLLDVLSAASSIATIMMVAGTHAGAAPAPQLPPPPRDLQEIVDWAATSAGPAEVSALLAQYGQYPNVAVVLGGRLARLRRMGL